MKGGGRREEGGRVMHIIQSVLHTISLTDFQLCKRGAGVHVTAGSSGPPLSPSLPLSQLLVSAPQQ